MAIICKCLPQRERNEIYKKKSIGFQGEALNSLCKSSKVTITTKHNDEPTGLKVQFGGKGEIISLEPVEMATSGSLVEIREIFRNNFVYKNKFRKNIHCQFENAMRILTSYSLIMTNTVFHVTNGFSSFANNGELMNDDDNDECFATEDLTTIFTTSAPGM